MNDKKLGTRKILKSIRRADKTLRKKFPILKHQNEIGFTLFFISILGMITSGLLYGTGILPFWVCIPLTAFFASILHEIEHDLIHSLYFPKNQLMYNLMMFGVWVFRGNTISPWYRKELHLYHHKYSGQTVDLEERLIGNGIKYGWKRILVMIDGTLSLIIQERNLKKEVPIFDKWKLVRSSVPFLFIFYFLWYNFLGLNLLLFFSEIFELTFFSKILEIANIPTLNLIAVVYLIPNYIRQVSIQIVSSNMHYYEDVDGLVEQTQVLNPWFLIPFQFFCFNFGATHGIHHFIVNQPFYLRQLSSKLVLPVMKKNGVRFNDLGTFTRANRYKPIVN
ncbi:MAG: fatty acid desaturase [Leptospiraceae bacterium]|nr:fatty acid desaturase [Leptospiraceae bacterium]